MKQKNKQNRWMSFKEVVAQRDWFDGLERLYVIYAGKPPEEEIKKHYEQ